MKNDCVRAETLAGAIALGEASDAQRGLYRRHLADCPACLTSLGGEREIERVMTRVARARTDERWEPAISNALYDRRKRYHRWSMGLATAAAALIAALGVHALVAQTIPSSPHLSSAISRAPSKYDERAIAELSTQTAPRLAHRAESLAVLPAGARKVMPHHGVVSFSVSIDGRGKPVTCTIVRGSGYATLDQAACQAAMRMRYVPRVVAGRAVASRYRGSMNFEPATGS